MELEKDQLKALGELERDREEARNHSFKIEEKKNIEGPGFI